MTKKHITILVVGILLAGGAGFWGGMTYANSSAQNARANRGNFTGASGASAFGSGAARTGGQPRGGSGFTAGEILSKDDTSVTLKLQDGSSKIVLYSLSTMVMKSATGTAQDLTVGEQVVAMGTANSDGSISATSLQLRSAGEGPGARPVGQ